MKDLVRQIGKRLPPLFLALTMALTLLPPGRVWAAGEEAAGEVASGTFDEGGTWTLYSSGQLVINGSMPDYTKDDTGDDTKADTRGWMLSDVPVTSIVLENCTRIGNWVFAKCTALESVAIPEGVTTIGESAFYQCTSLSAVTIPSSVTEIEANAFDGAGLTSVTIPGNVTNVGYSVFKDCKNLTNVTIEGSETKKTYGHSVFEYCTALEEVSVGAGLTVVPMLMFNACSNLTRVELPYGVTVIEQGGFFNAKKLAELALPDTVTTIDTEAFSGCNSLKELTIPSNVTKIGDKAFAGCAATLTFTGGVPTIVDNALSPILKLRYPYVSDPDSTLPAWNSVDAATLTKWGITADKMVAYGTSRVEASNDQTVDLSSENPTLVIQSSNIPFDPTEAVKVSNYTPDNAGVTVYSAEIYGEGNMGVQLIFNSVEGQSYSARASEQVVYITLDPAVFAAELLDEEGKTWENIMVGALFSGVPATESETPTVSETPTETPTETESPTPEPSATPEPAPPSRPSGGGSSSSSDRTPAPVVTELPFPEVVAPPSAQVNSPLQDIVKGEPQVDWMERIAPPEYALELYEVLVSGSDEKEQGGASGSGKKDLLGFLVADENFQLAAPAEGSGEQNYEVTAIETVAFSMLDPYAGGTDAQNGGLRSMAFEDDAFFTVDPTKADKGVNYAALQLGDVVRTESFNGVYVTKLPKDGEYDTKKKEVSAYIGTVFQAFDMDRPEVFWLSGKCKVRIITAADAGGVQTAYFFLTLADKDGFTMRSPDWTAAGAVAAGIARREAAVERILSQVTGDNAVDKLKAINRILTESNEYNTTPDLTTIGNEPHECLAALEGRVGNNGPVCDGYSRAVKVLCDRLGIPCVLETGYAKPTAESGGTFHMWNSVQVGENWYGADVTWNDPVVSGVSGAKSGRENEQYLLVGSATEIRGMTFGASHPVTNYSAEGGVEFNNGPILSATAFSMMTYQSGLEILPYTDVAETAWYYGAVSFVHGKGLMKGVGDDLFQPEGTVTRQQVWMVLARLSGEEPADLEAARQWAVEAGVSDGTDPLGIASREQLVTLLCRFGGHSGGEESLAAFGDQAEVAEYAREAFGWAVEQGIVTGTPGNTLSPKDGASRAEFATVLQRYVQATTAQE